jgi:hypothetical protein
VVSCVAYPEGVLISRLLWVEELARSIERATGDAPVRFAVADTVDPIKKHVILVLPLPLSVANTRPLKTLVRGFAEANDCVVETVRHTTSRVVCDVLIKRRVGPASRVNPLK